MVDKLTLKNTQLEDTANKQASKIEKLEDVVDNLVTKNAKLEEMVDKVMELAWSLQSTVKSQQAPLENLAADENGEE